MAEQLELPRDVVDLLLGLMRRYSLVKAVTLHAALSFEVTVIDFSSCQQLEDILLQIIVQRCPQLEQANFSCCTRLTSVESMRAMESLRWLNIDECNRISEIELLSVTHLSCRGVGRLSLLVCPQLVDLNASGVLVVGHVSVGRSLKSLLAFENSYFARDSIIEVLSLQRVHLSGGGVSDRSLKALQDEAHDLRELKLFNCPHLSNLCLWECLEQSVNLESLSVIQCAQITRLNLETNLDLKHLKTDVSSVNLPKKWTNCLESFKSHSGVPFGVVFGPSIVKLQFSRCGEFDLDHMRLLFAETPNLRYLNLSECFLLTDQIVALFPLYLERLNLAECDLVTDSGVFLIAQMCNLQMLNLSKLILLSDASASALISLTDLRGLNLSYCRNLTDNSALILKCFPNLEILELNFTSFSLQCVFQNVSSLRRLSVLHLDGLLDCSLQFPPSIMWIETLSLAWCDSLTDSDLLLIIQSLINVSNLDIAWCRRISCVSQICLLNRNLFRLRLSGLTLETSTRRQLQLMGLMVFL